MMGCEGDSAVSVNRILPGGQRCGCRESADSLMAGFISVSVLDLAEYGWHNDTYTGVIVEVW